ncbi:MAG TPA: GvpL/GvpF family gas vesicle protein [Thermoanaerobaculia bacterium]|nr:GvpL/GvpF family gas vesicle protein [Thermoanaerobaculia bacterium]
MSRGLYLYALARAGDEAPLGEGLAGEPLRRLDAGPVAAILGEIAAPPVTPEALAAHDAVVRRLADSLPALLPARFGQTVPDEQTLSAWIAARERDVLEALALVEGCVQMTLRVFAGPDAPHVELPAAPVPEDLGPGARFLHARRDAAARARALPEIAPLREALRPYLRSERVERAASPGRLLATAYDLVARGEADAYARTVAEAAPHLAGWRVTASGPWPPYAFAPGLTSGSGKA